MSESDVLQRAATALRAAHDGQREGSGFTRARILGTLSERRRRRPLRWLVLAPLGSLLLVGSAWAQSTGSWSRVWQAVASVLTLSKPPAAPPTDPQRAAPGHSIRRERQEPKPAALPELVPELPAAAPVPELPRPSSRPRLPAPATAKAARTGAAVSPPPIPADPELGTFRAAHERHVRGEPRAAIQAYADYLRAYPHGRFVPEAQYNTALDWIKLGDTAAARAALTPFAEGAYSGYRQREARELLEALAR